MDTPETKICTKCLIAKPLDEFGNDKYRPDGKRVKCRQCMSERRRELYPNRADKARAATAAWRKNNPEDYQASVEKGRTKKNARRRERYLENKEKENTQNNAWYEANKEERKRTMAAWDAAHPDYPRLKSQRRRARIANIPIADLSEEQWQEILIAFNHRCAYCPADCKQCKNKTHDLHQDHVEPVVNGGGYTVHNIVPCCKRCNSKKGTGAPPVPVQPLLLTIAPPNKPKKSA